ncbi:Ferredoxin [Saccharopolyspora antimicrobica]|uniref:Ferredoxin n=1 Tax=Saccharopolyspora antimicrobica TaxID=455193 RepID=A0A1I5GR23_9PSEU|nr:ferredoxin [Saccharopolyspora antimicrobica]RKT87402.1 ferredoxin [Saccharopolyspora antimicrobica]SFO38306.1 Ferredoxin [Saccharopolyspora antimicrobica]
MNVIADKEKCIGAGQCALIAADVFDQNDGDGRVLVLDPAPPRELLAQVEQAAAGCPALAITLQR